MATARSELVSLEATPYYHCISRCVRRAFLMGTDARTGDCFDHRKEWLVELLGELASVFALEVCAYAVMSNHYHVVIRIVRGRAEAWSDEEVLDRAQKLFPMTVKALRREAKESPAAKKALATKVLMYRERLFSLSWFMRCLNERIARRANREDGVRGRFWEGRFQSQPLLDAGALLTCMSYVDLNPVRAGLADSLSGSDFTSIQARLRSLGVAVQDGSSSTVPLAPLHGDSTGPDVRDPSPDVREADVRGVSPDDRDDKGLGPLPITLEDYVALVRFTGQAVREDGHAATLPPTLAATLQRVGLDEAHWLRTLRDFPSRAYAMLGERHLIDAEAARRGKRRARGAGWAKGAYRSAA